MPRFTSLVLGLGPALVFVSGCASRPETAPNAIRPPRAGQPVVLLVDDGEGYVPLACHDPVWDSLRGAADCADLIPPGAKIRTQTGVMELADRAPMDCVWSFGVRFQAEGRRSRLAVWPASVDLHFEPRPVEPLPAPPPWSEHTRGGWYAEVPGGTLWSLDLGGFHGLFFGDPPEIVDHFVDAPTLHGSLDLDNDGEDELLVKMGPTWAVYRVEDGTLHGVAGCWLGLQTENQR